MVLMATLLAPGLRSREATSPVDLLSRRFEGSVAPLLAGLVVAGSCFVFLTLQFLAIGQAAQSALEIDSNLAIAATAGVTALVLAAGGARAAIWTAAPLLVMALAAIVLPLGVWTLAKHGWPVGQLAYGKALEGIAIQEIDMISAELADAVSLKPHSRPFLQVDYVNTLALIACIMTGTAALPHVLSRAGAAASVTTVRSAMAWALLLAAVALTALPAYAALSKHEIYSNLARGLSFSDLPKAFSRSDVEVHGVRLRLYESVIGAVRAGAADADGVDNHLQAGQSADASAWTHLAPAVRDVLLAEARQDGGDAAQRFEVWRSKILPVAAQAAGNLSGKLTQSGLLIAPDAAVYVGFSLAGLGTEWSAVLATGCILAALATAMAAAWTLGQAASPSAVSPRGRATLASVTVAAGALAVYGPTLDWMRVAAWTFSLLAAGLFPVLVASIWWHRTSAAGAAAGIVTGLVATLAYIGATEFQPRQVDRLNAAVERLVTVPPEDHETLADPALTGGDNASDSFGGGDSDEAKPATGDGRLFGIDNSAAGLFGLPLGFLAIILVSLVSRRRPEVDARLTASEAPAS